MHNKIHEALVGDEKTNEPGIIPMVKEVLRLGIKILRRIDAEMLPRRDIEVAKVGEEPAKPGARAHREHG